VLLQFARGPAYDKYQKQLEESCDQWWKSGRQLCENISLTGNHCVHPVSNRLKMSTICNRLNSESDSLGEIEPAAFLYRLA
jgi:hypothetical protein